MIAGISRVIGSFGPEQDAGQNKTRNTADTGYFKNILKKPREREGTSGNQTLQAVFRGEAGLT